MNIQGLFVLLQNAEYVIILEEDLDVSPDFFKYVIFLIILYK